MSSFFDAVVQSAHRHCRWLAFFDLVQSSLWTTFACAQSPASTIKEFGLFGTWANDCGAAPSPANQYAIFSLTSRGNIELRNDFGPDYDEMLYRIVDAQRLSHFRLALRQLLTSDDQVVLNTVMMKANDRIRVWSSHGSDGSTFVEDGTMPSANGQETGWMMRCGVRWTDNPDPDLKRPAFERFRKSHTPLTETLVAGREGQDR
jgi:hypothetical protein